ncbi:MAG: nitroreductase [Spirochaetales bacterium]|nr:MAG: nitroreductase [Spirochaetales bacterium]
MTVHDAIRNRKSVRSFQDRPVEHDKLERVMEAGRLAPSARNDQEWRFVVVTDAATREQLIRGARNQTFVGQAPAVIVACADTNHRLMSCGHPSFLIDVSIALDHITLAAVDEGLGTCWIGAFDPDLVREILGIPAAIEVIELMPIGYPADPDRIEKKRLPMNEIVHWERWG